MPITSTRLKVFLDEQSVMYQSLHHRPDFTAQETAAVTHTPGREFAKTVLIRIDDQVAMVVLPAHHRVDFTALHEAFGAKHLRLCTEEEAQQVFPDCEPGAAPPFGTLYGVMVILSDAMAGDDYVTFNAGTHEEAVRMRYLDFVKLVRPRMMPCSRSS